MDGVPLHGYLMRGYCVCLVVKLVVAYYSVFLYSKSFGRFSALGRSTLILLLGLVFLLSINEN